MAIPLMAMPAMASMCVTDTVANYEALGSGGCTLDGLTFFNISVSTLGDVTLGNFTPVTPAPGEYGLSLNYTADAAPGVDADVIWTYDVSGNLISDAYATFTGVVTGTGTATLGETLSPGGSIELSAPGTVGTLTITPPASQVFVSKDQQDYSGTAGTSGTSDVVNAFSLTTTPIPGTLPLFATGVLGLWGLRRKRSKKTDLALAA